MVKTLTLKHFLITFLVFWSMTLWAEQHFFDVAQLNLAVGGALLVCFFPIHLSKQQKIALWLCYAIITMLTFFISAKFWAPWLFTALVITAIGFNWRHIPANVYALLLVFVAAFFNLSFITNTHIGDVQYDFASCYNYIEYIMENDFKFWQENPLLTRPSYSTYHPILHFFLAATAIRFGEFFGFTKDVASEAAQIWFVFYMMWYGIICAKILAMFTTDKRIYLPCLAVVVFFPTYRAITGFFNNDCLLLALQAGVIYYSLCYYQNGGKRNLFYIFLFATLACLTKLSGILVLPFTAVAFLLRMKKYTNKQTFLEVLGFGLLILAGISLWPLYQHFILHVGLSYVPPQQHLSLESYNLWERFSPLGAFLYEKMFYNDFGINLWETMTKTALFGQWDFTLRGALIMPIITLMVWTYKILIAGVIGAIFYLGFKAKNKVLFGLCLVLLISLISGQIAFVLTHPFMCNQDFRYVAVLPLIFMMIMAQFLVQSPPMVQRIAVSLLILFSFLAAFIWQWVSV